MMNFEQRALRVGIKITDEPQPQTQHNPFEQFKSLEATEEPETTFEEIEEEIKILMEEMKTLPEEDKALYQESLDTYKSMYIEKLEDVYWADEDEDGNFGLDIYETARRNQTQNLTEKLEEVVDTLAFYKEEGYSEERTRPWHRSYRILFATIHCGFCG